MRHQASHTNASSKTRLDTADARVPLTRSLISCAPHTRRLIPSQQERLRAAFTEDEAHISIEVTYHCPQQVRDVFHRDTPTRATRLVKCLPTCHVPKIACLGQTLRKRQDVFLFYVDTGGASNAPHRSQPRIRRPRQRHRQRLPHPHQLQTPNGPHHRRPSLFPPHPPMKRKNKERGPLPGLLTVDYFTTSPGGILAPHTRVSSVSRKTRVRHQATQQHTS